MSTDAHLFHKALQLGEFNESRLLIDRIMRDGTIGTFVDSLAPLYGSASESHLRVRDHVLFALNARPIYTALQVDSENLLLRLGDANNLEDARRQLLALTREMFEKKSPDLVSRRLEFELLSLNEYAIMSSDVIQYHTDMLANVQVPYSILRRSGRELIRYSLRGLFDSHYGEMALASVGISRNSKVIGEEQWFHVRSLLEQLDLEPDQILVEVAPEDWQEALDTFRSTDNAYPRMAVLERVYQTRLLFKAGSKEKRRDAIASFKDSSTFFLFDQIVELFNTGNSSERLEALRVMEAMSVPKSKLQAIVSPLLSDSSSVVRKKAAEIFSKVASRDFQIRTDPGSIEVAARSLDDYIMGSEWFKTANLKLLESYLSHFSPLVRVSAVRALRHAPPGEIGDLLLPLMNDEDYRVRKAVVESVHHLSEPYSTTVIRQALEDDHVDVQTTAKRQLKRERT